MKKNLAAIVRAIFLDNYALMFFTTHMVAGLQYTMLDRTKLWSTQ